MDSPARLGLRAPLVLRRIEPHHVSYISLQLLIVLTHHVYRLTVTRIAVGIQVLFAGIALPHKYMKTEARSLLTLLAGYMPAGWFTCGLFIVGSLWLDFSGAE